MHNIIVEQYHFDELDINEPNVWNELDTIGSDFEKVEDNSAKDSSFELEENYEWNPSDPYDFLNEISDEYRNFYSKKLKIKENQVKMLIK